MAKTEITVTEQQTEPIDFALLRDANGDGVPEEGLNLSAVDHIELHRVDRGGTADSFTSAGTAPGLSFPTGFAAAGSVRWTPGTADIVAARSPYRCQFKVFVTASRWYYVPEDTRFGLKALEMIG